MTMPKLWSYESAMQTLVREIFRGLSVNKDRDEDCTFMAQIAWEATFAIKMKHGDSPHDAMFVLLDDQEPDEENRNSLMKQWDRDVEDIEILDAELGDDEDNPDVNRFESWFTDLRQRLQDKLSYPEETERKSS